MNPITRIALSLAVAAGGLASVAVEAATPVPCATCPGYGYHHGHGVHKAHPYGPRHSDRVAYRQASGYSWHGAYNYTQWGVPVALVVPPNAEKHTEWGWGAAETRVYRINHQFNREYPGGVVGPAAAGPTFRHTPIWPSDTTQFGVYPVRGPWD